MDAKEAYEKTTKLVRAYESGDLLGGNPMEHIEQYANDKVKEVLISHRESLIAFDKYCEKRPIKEYKLTSKEFVDLYLKNSKLNK